MAFIVGGITVVISVSALKTRFYSRSGLFFQRKILDWVCVSSSADGDVEERFFFFFFALSSASLQSVWSFKRGSVTKWWPPPHTHTHTAPLFKIHLFLIPILRWMLTSRVCRIKGSAFTSDSLSQSLFGKSQFFFFFYTVPDQSVVISCLARVCVCKHERSVPGLVQLFFLCFCILLDVCASVAVVIVCICPLCCGSYLLTFQLQ